MPRDGIGGRGTIRSSVCGAIAALLWLGLLEALLPAAALALDQGGGQVGVSYYSLRFRTLGQQFNLSETYGYLDLFQRLTNYGVLEGRIAYSNSQEAGDGSGWKQAYGRLSLKEYRWGRGIMGLTAGDQFFALSTLPVRFTNFFYPDTYFRGFSMRYVHPWFELLVLGGDVTRSRGLLGETFQGMGEGLYGFLLRTQPLERWNLESGLFATQDEKDFTGNLVDKHNLVYRLATQVRAWSQLYLAGEFMESFSEAPDSHEQQDTAYRAGAMWRGEKLQLEANYRDIGPRFHLINQIYEPDRAVRGYYVSSMARPWPFLSVFGSYDSSQVNLLADPSRSFNETELKSGGLRLYREPWPIFFWRYYESTLSTRSDFPVQVRGLTQVHYGELSKRYKFLEGYIHYERFHFQDQIAPNNSYRKDAPLIGLRGYHKKITWYLEGEYDRYNPVSQGQGFDGPYLKLGANYFYSPTLSGYGEVSYRTKSRRFGGMLGVNWQLPYGFQLTTYGRWEKGTSGVGDYINNYQTNQVILKLTKTLSWGKKAETAGLKPGQDWLGSGSIEGWVFNDVNGSGSMGAGGEGVEGIKVKLEDGTTVTTDRRGFYQFPAVSAGKHIVTLEARKIPAAYTFEGAETTAVEVKRRASARVDFPFVKGAVVKGRILYDRKPAGKEAQGVPDVLVALTPGDQNTFTDSEGYFSFEGILPKTYELSVDPETLPEFARVSQPSLPLRLELKPGEQKKDLAILVHLEERRIIFK